MNRFIRILKLPFHYGKLLLVILQCKALLAAALLRNGLRVRRILTLPHSPYPHSALYKICHRLGYIITRDAKREADLVVFWQDSSVRDECRAIEEFARQRRVINHRCRDIRKRRVAEVFEEVFGYGLQVQPREHRGPIVRKSDESNGCHDGRIIMGPVAEEDPGFVYQKVVNNIEAGYARDIRVPVFGSHISYGVDKLMPIKYRFTNITGLAVLRGIRELVTEDELAAIKAFCVAFGLDYGELDLLRDRDDGKLYIVDVNNTPYGPLDRHIDVKWFFDRTAWEGLERMAHDFSLAFTDNPEFAAPRST